MIAPIGQSSKNGSDIMSTDDDGASILSNDESLFDQNSDTRSIISQSSIDLPGFNQELFMELVSNRAFLPSTRLLWKQKSAYFANICNELLIRYSIDLRSLASTRLQINAAKLLRRNVKFLVMSLTNHFESQTPGTMKRRPLQQIEQGLICFQELSSGPDLDEEQDACDTERSDTPRLDEVRTFLFEGRPFDDLVKRFIKRARASGSLFGSHETPSVRRGAQHSTSSPHLLSIRESPPQSSDQSEHSSSSTKLIDLGSHKPGKTQPSVLSSVARAGRPVSDDLAEQPDQNPQASPSEETTSALMNTFVINEASNSVTSSSTIASSSSYQTTDLDRMRYPQNSLCLLQSNSLSPVHRPQYVGNELSIKTEFTPLLSPMVPVKLLNWKCVS